MRAYLFTVCMICFACPIANGQLFDPVLELSELDPTEGFILQGAMPGDQLGDSVAGAGDINGDGFADVLIGARGVNGVGAVYGVYGGATVGASGLIELGQLTSQSGFILHGANDDLEVGSNVAGADFNGDGYSDAIVGAEGSANFDGRGYVVFGGTNLSATIDLSSLNGVDGFRVDALLNSGQSLGDRVAALGDVNNDGYEDAGFSTDLPNSYVLFGGPLVGSSGQVAIGSLSGADGFASDAERVYGGDFNGDGIDDLFFSEPNTAVSVSVHYGSSTIGSSGIVSAFAPGPNEGFVVTDTAANSQLGDIPASIGDINGDGFEDFAASAIDQVSPDSLAYVFLGGNTQSSFQVDSSTQDNPSGLTIIGPNDGVIEKLAAAGDINGDGIEDLILATEGSGVARAYVIYGSNGIEQNPVIDLDSLGDRGFLINTTIEAGYFEVDGAGDVNGDGVDDLILADLNAGNAGEAYVIFGRGSFSWTPSGGGSFDDSSNWAGGTAPSDGGVVDIELPFGGTVVGPSEIVQLDRFTFDSDIGTAVLSMTGGVLFVDGPLTIGSNARVEGIGLLASVETFCNHGEIDLTGGLEIDALTFENKGLLRGDGRIYGTAMNLGRIEAIDLAGEMIFTDILINESDSFIAQRRSKIRLGGGLTNEGQLSVGDGESDLIGDVINTGQIGLSSSAVLSIIGNLDQQGTLNLIEGSRLIVFGDMTGPGGALGTGTVEVLGTLSIGSSPAEVSFGGDLVLGSSATTIIELGGLEIGEFDRLVIEGEGMISGVLDLQVLEGFSLRPGQQFEIVDADGWTGGFTGLDDGDIVGVIDGQTVRIDYGAGDGDNIALIVEGLAGDFNEDGFVDAADYTLWRDLVGQSSNLLVDANGDQFVDDKDYAIWADNFGSSSPSVSVPEPTSLLLFACLGIVAFAPRK